MKDVTNTPECNIHDEESKNVHESMDSSSLPSSSSSSGDEQTNSADCSTINSLHNTITFKKFEKLLKNGLPPFAGNEKCFLEYHICTFICT